jgi:beta-glucosidase
MPNMKLLKHSLLLAAGLLVAPACRLDPPKTINPPGTLGACIEDPDEPVDAGVDGVDGGDDGPAGDDGPGSDGGTAPDAVDINRVITPMSCSAMADNPYAVEFKYAPGYVQDPSALKDIDMLVATMSLADKTKQMRGTLFGSAFGPQYNDIQRSTDTSQIRGFRYRDASRGVNLGEDMAGATPNAGIVNRQHVGYATVFPVSMARGAAFDLDLEYAIGEAIGDEMQAAKETLLLAPCMNLLRHPYWGRAQETYSEDPFLIGRLASAMVVGVQQHIAANAKHFMGYDIEVNRDVNNSQMDEQTLREIYGRHFRMVVQDGGVASVMASYNKVNGTKSTQNKHTLTEVLRDDFGFKGFVLSDWWAMPPQHDASTDPSLLKTYAVEAVNAGLDVDLPWALSYGQLENIVKATAQGQNAGLAESDLTPSVKRVLEQKLRFKADKRIGAVGLGTPITQYRKSEIHCNGPHLAVAEKAAIESMVLLKNDSGTLPIPPTVQKLAVVGATVPYATDNGGSTNTGGLVNFAIDVRTGDLGSSRAYQTPAKGIGPFAGFCRSAGGTPNVVTSMQDGTETATCDGSTTVNVTTATNNGGDISPVMAAAAAADFVVVMAGLTAQDEGEEYTKAADRTNGCRDQTGGNLCFALDAKQSDPKYQTIQNDLIRQVAALHKPMVVVLEGGSVIDLPWLDSVPAVVMAWYPGQRGGAALSKLLWGKANFSGKLPFTWGKTVDQYDTWNGNGTTVFDYHVGYSWFDYKKLQPQFPFGYGLSYTTFEYRKLQLGCSDMTKGAVLPVVINVANTGPVAGDEIAMVWVSFPNTMARRPAKELKGFARVHLAAGEEKQITIPVRLSDLDYFKVDAPGATTGHWVVESGDVNVMVGGSSASLSPSMSQTVTVKGY